VPRGSFCRPEFAGPCQCDMTNSCVRDSAHSYVSFAFSPVCHEDYFAAPSSRGLVRGLEQQCHAPVQRVQPTVEKSVNNVCITKDWAHRRLRVAVRCSALHCVADIKTQRQKDGQTDSSNWTRQRLCVAVCCSVLQCNAVWCSVLQGVAGCCRVLQGVAECCMVL